MNSNKFSWSPDLPSINKITPENFMEKMNELLDNPNKIKIMFDRDLEKLVESNKIKRYKKLKTYHHDKVMDKITRADIVSDKLMVIRDLGYEIAIKHESSIEPIDYTGDDTWKYINRYDYCNIQNWKPGKGEVKGVIDVPKPWHIIFQKIEINNLKSQDNVKIIMSIGINTEEIKYEVDEDRCEHEFRRFEFNVSFKMSRLVWECIHCGKLCHCECFREGLEEKDRRSRNAGMSSSVVRQIKKSTGKNISNLPYCEDACEVCRGRPSTHKATIDMYARSEFEKRYGAYINKKYYELLAKKYPNTKLKEMSKDEIKKLKRKANNLMREKLGFKKIGKKYVTETELYRIVNSLFPDKEVIHHYNGDWLKGQELDIFIPDLNLGIEYHGKQHFEPIEAWGGKAALKKNKKRDKEKKQKCKENGVELIVFTYKEKDKLNENYIAKKIRK